MKLGKVNFFIIGYPKSGTTSLYSYLKSHPNVFMPQLKEPHFFTEDFPGIREVKSLREYEALFADVSGKQIKGDASASVIHSEIALKKILEYSPDAKFILMIRNPLQAVQSFHSELLYNLNENEDNFEKAWHLQSQRANGSNIPSSCKEPKLLQYSKIFRYREQLPKFYDLIPENQRLTLVFEEFFSNTGENYKKVLDFLELEEHEKSDFEHANAAKKVKMRWLSLIHRKLTRKKGRTYQFIKKVLNSIGIHPSSLLEKFNLTKASKRQISEDFEKQLVETFQKDVEIAEKLIGRSIEKWSR